MTLVIGNRIMVKSKDNDSSRVAIVAIVNDNNTVDLNDEDNVDINRISQLQDFELLSSSSSSSSSSTSTTTTTTTNALEEKEYGNILFGLKDYNSSIDRYKRSLLLLDHSNVLSIGSEVLVQNIDSYQYYRSAMISDITNNEKYDIIYDETFDNNNDNNNNDNLLSEESNVIHNRIFNLSSSSLLLSSNIRNNTKNDNGINIQKAVLMNIAKCYYQQRKYGLAIRYISLFIALIDIIKHNNNNNNDSNNDDIKKKADALWIQCKSFLAAGRPNLAKKAIKQLAKYDKQRR